MKSKKNKKVKEVKKCRERNRTITQGIAYDVNPLGGIHDWLALFVSI